MRWNVAKDMCVSWWRIAARPIFGPNITPMLHRTLVATGLSLATFMASAQWITLNSGTTEHLYGVHFPTPDIGYVVGGGGTILKTVNAGLIWQALNSGTDTLLNSVWFVNEDTGVVVGDGSLILRTTDGGNTWTTVLDNGDSLASNLESVHFPSELIGYACGWGRAILKTTDGGQTWTRQTPFGTRAFRGLYMTSNTTGVCVGYDQILLSATRATTDDGMNWSGGATSGHAFNVVVMVTPDTGYAAGALGDVYRTEDAGASWIYVAPSGQSEYYYGLWFSNVDTGYVAGFDGVIRKTVDRGASWFLQNYEFGTRMEGLYFTDVNTGYAVGADGRIRKTVNGGGWNVGIEESEGSSAILAPNPFGDRFGISLGSKQPGAFLTLMDPMGRIVLSREVSDGETIAAGNLPAGVYLWRLLDETGNVIGHGRALKVNR